MKKSTTITLVVAGALATIAGVVTYALINKKDSRCLCACSKDKKEVKEVPVEETQTEIISEECADVETDAVVEVTETPAEETE